jgi:thiamine-monophosphate kinase
MLVEGVHFVRDKIPPSRLGRKALMVNLSDIAAMGGMPRGCFLSLSLPAEIEINWVDAFIEGLIENAKEMNCPLLGGDTTRSPSNVVINIAVVGEAPRDKIKRRSGGRVGDVLAVTGYLGDSGGGLRLLLENRSTFSDDDRALLDAHFAPRAHLEEGRWLAGREEVRAMMDVSDGLDSDVRRMMDQSGIAGARIELDMLPVSESLRRAAAAYGWSIDALAATAGEDYCLLCAIAAEQFDTLAADFAQKFGRPLYRVGELLDREGVYYMRRDQSITLDHRGFDHFARA